MRARTRGLRLRRSRASCRSRCRRPRRQLVPERTRHVLQARAPASGRRCAENCKVVTEGSSSCRQLRLTQQVVGPATSRPTRNHLWAESTRRRLGSRLCPEGRRVEPNARTLEPPFCGSHRNRPCPARARAGPPRRAPERVRAEPPSGSAAPSPRAVRRAERSESRVPEPQEEFSAWPLRLERCRVQPQQQSRTGERRVWR